MSRSRCLLAGAALILLTVVTRLPALVHPRAMDDEEVYSLVADEMIHGGRPYIDAIERKPPLLFWTYAAIFDVAGPFNWRALHGVAIIWTLATMAGLYTLTSRLRNREAGLLAALLYGLFLPWATWKNLALDGELLMNLPVVWAWAIALGPSRSRGRPELAVAGGLLAAAFFLKQPAAIAALPLGLYVLLPNYRRQRAVGLANSFGQALILTAGFAVALGAVVWTLHREGILAEAFYWTITNHALPHVFWARAALFTTAFVAACLPLLIGAVQSLRQPAAWETHQAERTALAMLVAVSAVGAAAGGRFYPHYYIQLLPPLAVLAAIYYQQLSVGAVTPPRWLPTWRTTVGWLAATAIGFFIAHVVGLAAQRQPTEAGHYLLEHAAPTDRIFVWGQSPAIYLDARRRPASRYITTFALTGYIFGDQLPGTDTSQRIVPGAWDNLDHDFAAHPPAFIVDTETGRNALYPSERFPRLSKLLAQDFEPLTRTAEGVIYVRRKLASQQSAP